MRRILFQFAFGLLLGVLAGKAIAQHECQGGHNCNENGETIVGLDGDRLLALSNSLGGVDVSGCIITKQWSIIVFARQHYEYDPWCLAGILDENGKYVEAAAMRCTDKETEKIYGADCTTVLNFEPQGLIRNDWEERYIAQQEEITMVQEELATMKTRKRPVIIEQKPFLTAEKRAALEELKK